MLVYFKALSFRLLCHANAHSVYIYFSVQKLKLPNALTSYLPAKIKVSETLIQSVHGT